MKAGAAVRLTVIVGLLCLLLSVGAYGQSGLGSITGHVTDPSGAVIRGAKVAAVSVETNLRKEVVTNSAGVYEIRGLNPGTYRLEATAANFKKAVRTDITVQVEDKIGLDLQLAVGAATESVEVHAEAPALRTEDAQTGEVVTNQLIETLPNFSTGTVRDPLKLLNLAGNIQGSGDRAGWTLGLTGRSGNPGGIYDGPADTRANGGRTSGVEYLVDGVPVTMGFVHNVSNATPATEDIAEFKVVTGGISAEYGRLSGGAVSIATKAGGNEIHGQLFEYHQDSYLNANNWNNIANKAAKENFRQNEYGFAIGGPLTIPHLYNGKDRTFWYANFDGLKRSSSGNTQLGQTITDQERNGDLTDIGVGLNDPNFPWAQVYDPYNAKPCTDPDTGNATYCRALAGGDGRHIPANEINPVIKAYINLMPHPNHAPTPGTGTAGNYLVRQPNRINQKNWSIRVDEKLNDKSNMYARFTHNSGDTWTGPYNPLLGTYDSTRVNGGFGTTLHYTYTLSPTTILDFHVGGNYSPFESGSHLPANFDNSSFGYSPDVLAIIGKHDIVNIHNGALTEGQNVGGLNQGGQYWPLFQSAKSVTVNSTSFDYAGSLTKVLSRHTLKFGYEGRRYYDNFATAAQSNANNPGDGAAFVAGAVTGPYADQNNTWSPQAYANGVGQFLLGIDTWTRMTGAVGRSLAQNYYASYVQDDFKVSKKLTLNLGLRWEMETPVTERHNNISVWDPNAAAPFTITPGYDWNAALTAAGLNPSQVRTPAWVSGGYPKGNLVLVGTPEHPSNKATNYHSTNFSPRLGMAYQIDSKTVARASFSMLYLPTANNLTTYGDAPGVYYSSSLSNLSTQNTTNENVPQNGGPNLISSPFGPGQSYLYAHDTHTANIQTAQSNTGTGGIYPGSHMPHEFNWGLSVQRELPGNWIVELGYSANSSNTLLANGNPSRFPADLHTGGPDGTNAKIYSTQVASPIGNQVPCPVGQSCTIGPTMSLGILEYKYPYYGPVGVEGMNIGTANYQSANLRVEHRFKNGFQVLFNYTYSKALDDVGGPDSNIANPGQPADVGGRSFQQVYDIKSVYGLSGLDQTHKASLIYVVDLPFGRNRRWMNHPEGTGEKILDGVIGGWGISGRTSWASGTPIQINAASQNIDQTPIYDFVTFASFAPGKGVKDLFNPNFKGASSVVVPPGSQYKDQSVSAFNLSALAYGGNASSFTNGDVPPTIGNFRNPRNWTSDLAISKNFALNKDGKRYLQLRLEGLNIFNHPGYGAYDTNVQDSTFGQITGVPNTERHIQISGRLVF